MAKEKKQIPKNTKKDFFYEISGTLTILLCLVLLSELGSVGVILKKVSKIIFGDFYFIIVIYLIIHGIYALVREKWFDFKSIRFNGFILFMASFFMLVHISFVDLYDINSSVILSNTIDIYKDNIFSDMSLSSFGGGIIGAILAQIFSVLFSKIGAIIFAVIFMILAFSFMTNLSFKRAFFSIRFVGSKVKKIGIVMYKYFSNINYPNKKEDIKRRGFLVNLNLLSDIPITQNDFLQKKISKEEMDMITRLVYQNNSYISSSKMYVGYSSSRYQFFGSFLSINENQIDSLLNRKTIVYKTSNSLTVEVTNRIKKLLSLKSVLLLNLSQDIPLGIEINESVLYFNPLIHQNLLISGDYGSGIKTFIKSFMISLIFRLKENFSLVLVDYTDEFTELKYIPNLLYPVSKKTDNLDDLLDDLTIELEKRISIIEEYDAENYLNLNKTLKDKKINQIKPIFIIFNDLDSIRRKNYNINHKLIYLLKFGYKSGIHFILINRTFGIDGSILSNTKTKILLKTSSIEQSFEICKSKNGCALGGNGDAIFIQEINIYHIQLPFISDTDFKRVINKFILN